MVVYRNKMVGAVQFRGLSPFWKTFFFYYWSDLFIHDNFSIFSLILFLFLQKKKFFYFHFEGRELFLLHIHTLIHRHQNN